MQQSLACSKCSVKSSYRLIQLVFLNTCSTPSTVTNTDHAAERHGYQPVWVKDANDFSAGGGGEGKQRLAHLDFRKRQPLPKSL